MRKKKRNNSHVAYFWEILSLEVHINMDISFRGPYWTCVLRLFQGSYEISKRTCTKLFNREFNISAQVGNGMLKFVSSDGTYNFIIHSSKLKSSVMRKGSHVVCPNSILSQFYANSFPSTDFILTILMKIMVLVVTKLFVKCNEIIKMDSIRTKHIVNFGWKWKHQ